MSFRIAIKNKSDSRYQAIERKYLHSLSKFFRRHKVATLGPTELCKDVGVYSSTFYNHYQDMDDAFSALNNKAKTDLQAIASDFAAKKPSSELVIHKILDYIYKNKDYYSAMLYRKNAYPILLIPETFRSYLCQNWKNYGSATIERIFTIYSWEFCGVLYQWGINEKFDERLLSRKVKFLVRLTKTACDRLA